MKALILVDIQNDFLPGGPLAIPEGDAIIPVVNRLQHFFDIVIVTQDWHPPNHMSFASNHPGKNHFDIIAWLTTNTLARSLHSGYNGSKFPCSA
jgi:nicotinamidase/pyrazinamidase